MPLPKPRSNEEENDFIKRCMANDLMNEEYPDQEQRAGVCYTQWRDRSKAMERKSIQIKLDEDKEGAFTVKIAELNVVDLDDDVTLPGAFPNGKEVLMSAYQHGSWMGWLPVGKAILKEDKKDVTAEGMFNLKMDSGKEHYESVKFSGGLQEWSYGFNVTESDTETRDGKQVRIIKGLDVHEISPVLLGAGINTATLAIKNKSTLKDQSDATLTAVEDWHSRLKSLNELRMAEGRKLSDKNREAIKEALPQLKKIEMELNDLLDDPQDYKEFLQLVRENIQFMEAQNV